MTEPSSSAAVLREDAARLLDKARRALESRNPVEAEKLCLQAFNIQRHPKVFLLLGLTLVNARRLDHAIQVYHELLKLDPGNQEALDWIANLLVQTGRFKDALTFAERALRLFPKNASSYATLGQVCFGLKNWTQAESCFARAIDLEPGLATNAYYLALANEQLERFDDAARWMRRAVQLAPNSQRWHLELGRIFIEAKDYAEAAKVLKALNEALPTAPGFVMLAKAYTEAERNSTKAYRLAEKLEDVLSALRKAIELDPKAILAYEMLGDRQQDIGQFEQAISSFKSALKIDDSSAVSYYGITRCRKITDDDRAMIERMEELLTQPLKTDEEKRHLNYGLAKAYDDTGNFEKAMSHFDEANRLAKSLRKDLPNQAISYNWAESKLFDKVDAELFSKYRSLGSESERPIFIVGMIRSGTTLMEQILSCHKDIVGGGEILHFVEPKSIDVLRKIMDGKPFEIAARELRREYDTILDRLGSGSAHVSDKMPINYIALGLIHLLYPKAKIVHCRRNPIDTCLSIYMTPLGNGPNFAYDRRKIVDTYREYLMIMEHWRSVLPPGVMLDVQYEELVGDSENKVRELISFLRLDWDDACLRPDENDRKVLTPSRWQARQPVYKTSVERWKRYEPWLGAFAELKGV